jgi:hypothetical protein
MAKILVAPLGYVLQGDPIREDDEAGLRAQAHTMVDAKETGFHEKIDQEDLAGLQKFFTDNAHTFKEE